MALVIWAFASPAFAEVSSLSSLAAFDEFRSQYAGFALLVYAPWCGHSKALLPEFEKAAASGGMPFAKADGTEAEDLATKLDIKGYPTLLFIHRGDGPPLEYDGTRQASSIGSWVTSKASPDVKQLGAASEVTAFVAAKPIALVLYVGGGASSNEVEALRGVAAATADVPCAVATSDPPSGSAPALVAYTKHDAGQYVLPPPLSHASMLHFARSHALPAVVEYAPGKVEEALFSSEAPAHLLFFHASAIEGAVATSLSEVGQALRGQALVATINVAKHADVASFFDIAPSGALPTPTLMGFSLANGTKFAHTGELTTVAMSGFVQRLLRGEVAQHLRSQLEQPSTGPLVELVGSSFSHVAHDPSKDVLVQFYSPTCGHCAKLRPVYERVAAKFADDDSIVVAQMDAVANDVAGLEPEGFPMIVLFSKANKHGIEYDGSRDVHDLVQFVEDARAGRNHIGGLSTHAGALGSPDEDDGYRVEL